MLRKYQNGGEEISEKQYFANYLKEAEATDAYMKTYPSLVKKPGGGYYMALEDGIYYPYNDDAGNQTIGYGRHTNTILKDYPNGISVAKANEFLLEDIDKKYDIAKDQYDFGHVGSGINFEGFGEGEFDKLSERERYMVTNFLYNPGHIYPKFSGALRDKDTKVAGEEYNIYMVTNKGEKNEKTQSLGRNAIFNRLFVEPWQDEINNPVEEPVKETEEGSIPFKLLDNSLRIPQFGDPGYINPFPGDRLAPGGAGVFGGWQTGGIKRQMGGTMMSNPSMYQQMQQLPGGTMQQIPGSDAIEFRGQTHKQGGILMDEETEVEDGETMDKVVMKDGQSKDYFFSSYLKKKGRSYADMHKEILSRGGNQEEINYLASMQEKAAKRSPQKIAKLGGLTNYATGGFDDPDPLSKKEKKAFQKELYAYYKSGGGTLSFRKWNKQNPFDLEFYTNYMLGEDYESTDFTDVPETTEGLRQDLPGAYGYRADAGDGYTICQSGNCQDGTGVMYTYYKENPNESGGAGTETGTVIGMYEGEFVDGKPSGQGKFTWNDVDASLSQGIPFVAWEYSSEGIFEVDETGHPQLHIGTKDWGDALGITTGVFKVTNKGEHVLDIGYQVKNGKTTNYEAGEKTKNFSKDAENNLISLGILEEKPFKYSQGDIGIEYKKMKNASGYTQPTETELNTLGYTSFDEFRADYERLINDSYDWKNVTHWGKQHEDALGKIRKAVEDQSFVTTGTFTLPVSDLTIDPNLSADPNLAHDPRGPVEICPCAPEYTNYSVPEGVDCYGCLDKDKEKKGKKGWFGFDDKTIPGLAIGSGLAQMGPAAYAFLHKQPAPEEVPFVEGVTSPVVPGRLRAKKLSHINMNLQRSQNDAQTRGMMKYIDESGGGPASIINRMAIWGKQHQNAMQIAGAEKQANIGIENQNVAIENQTNLHNVKMEQEAALGNMQVQAAEAQRHNEVLAINAAARNKIKDDEEYMKYAGVIAASQGVGSMFGDMLSYKGDMYRAMGYDIEGTTQRMLLRRHLGKTLKDPNTGDIFCEECTQEDIANYYNTFYPKPQSTIQ